MSVSPLTFRSDLLKAIRDYFDQQDVIEVTTPLVRAFGASEPHLDNIEVPGLGYLQTSPEYAMKILLASYGESIYQVCPAFRGGEVGARHQTEFQMLEWYRCGFTLEALLDDIEQLINHVISRLAPAHDVRLSGVDAHRVTYRQLFEARFGVNPHQATLSDLKRLARGGPAQHLDRHAELTDYLDTLFATGVEPVLDAHFVTDYPACQAALAECRQTSSGDRVSSRAELIVDGMEIANAYQELRDPVELASRFRINNEMRKKLGKPPVPDDPELLEALPLMPTCAGVALGIDRLAMALTGADDIGDVSQATIA